MKSGVERRVIKPAAMMSPELPYSWGIEAGDTLFIAGATARDPDTYQPVAGGVPEQMRRIMGNIGLVLEAAGMDYSQVANCRVFLDDPRTFGAMNEAYREFFPQDPPTPRHRRGAAGEPAVPRRGAVRGEPRGAERPSPRTAPARGAPSRRASRRATASTSPAWVPPGPDRSEDPGEQTRAVLGRLGAALEAAGLGFGMWTMRSSSSRTCATTAP